MSVDSVDEDAKMPGVAPSQLEIGASTRLRMLKPSENAALLARIPLSWTGATR